MGQKVNPIAFRIQVSNNWNSKWFSEKNYAINVQQDIIIQDFFKTLEKPYLINNVTIQPKNKTINGLTKILLKTST